MTSRRFLPVLSALALLAAAALCAQESDPRVYITGGGKHYHRSGCLYLGSSPIPIALSEAALMAGPLAALTAPAAVLAFPCTKVT